MTFAFFVYLKKKIFDNKKKSTKNESYSFMQYVFSVRDYQVDIL